jgi:hypothetical protein
MTIKALTRRQAHWAEILSYFYFMIIYKLGSQNRADPLTRRDQEMNSQLALKISTRSQTLLRPKNLDPWIITDLNLDPLVEVSPINPSGSTVPGTAKPGSPSNLVDELLQANHTDPDLELDRQKAIDQDTNWQTRDRLLFFQDRLVVPTNGNLRVRLLNEVHK